MTAEGHETIVLLRRDKQDFVRKSNVHMFVTYFFEELFAVTVFKDVGFSGLSMFFSKMYLHLLV